MVCFFLLLCYQFIRATVSAQRALSVMFTSCQFVMLLSIFYEQLNDDDDDDNFWHNILCNIIF